MNNRCFVGIAHKAPVISAHTGQGVGVYFIQRIIKIGIAVLIIDIHSGIQPDDTVIIHRIAATQSDVKIRGNRIDSRITVTLGNLNTAG